MNIKQLKSLKGRFLSALLIGELTLFLGSYYVYHSMNTSRDFRFYMYEEYPSILDGFYTMGEKLGNQKTRQIDHEIWRKEGKAP